MRLRSVLSWLRMIDSTIGTIAVQISSPLRPNLRPGIPFQTSMSRAARHSATELANSCWLLKLSPSLASCLLESSSWIEPQRRSGHASHRR